MTKGKYVIISESQFRNLINETPVLDKEYGKPLYDYLKQGEKYQYNGMIDDGKHLVPAFLHWLTDKNNGATDDEWNIFSNFCKGHNKLSNAIRCVDTWVGRKIEYAHVDGSEIKGNPMDWVKNNLGGLYRIFVFTPPISDLWEKFYQNYEYTRGNMENILPSNLIYNDVSQTQVEWMLHFTSNEINAVDIVNNGFKNGIDSKRFNDLAYTSNIPQEDKNGNISFAYLASDIIGNGFINKYTEKKYENNFDEKAWQNASHEAVMFQANGIKAFHKGDKDYSCLFNKDTARNFVRLHRTYSDYIPNKNNIRSNGYKFIWNVMGKDGKVLYYNFSLTNVVKWVVENYNQYRKAMEE